MSNLLKKSTDIFVDGNMSWIEGIGDEVIEFFCAVFLILIGMLHYLISLLRYIKITNIVLNICFSSYIL